MRVRRIVVCYVVVVLSFFVSCVRLHGQTSNVILDSGCIDANSNPVPTCMEAATSNNAYLYVDILGLCNEMQTPQADQFAYDRCNAVYNLSVYAGPGNFGPMVSEDCGEYFIGYVQAVSTISNLLGVVLSVQFSEEDCDYSFYESTPGVYFTSSC
ncbi:hypothetical protein EDE15_4244 [Edaphobacter aggregans]|uniref:Uncharacterized protein n=1 Tax=Edaphobacter aggregans TaxID=570835 RepID=A0A3R9PV99_9BACT|nr:hypothetical protein EDE15_4244 [Edaphobacter aggregans]